MALSTERFGGVVSTCADGSIWFKNANGVRGQQNAALAAFGGKGFVVHVKAKQAFDNWHVAFPSFRDFRDIYFAQLPVREDWCEVVRPTLPCRFYLDLEWVTPEPDEFKSVFDACDECVRSVLRDLEQGRSVAAHRLNGSRPVENGWKNSFHVIYQEVVFANFDDLLVFKELFFGYVDACPLLLDPVTGKCKVDRSVYSMRQSFRLPMAWKGRPQYRMDPMELHEPIGKDGDLYLFESFMIGMYLRIPTPSQCVMVLGERRKRAKQASITQFTKQTIVRDPALDKAVHDGLVVLGIMDARRVYDWVNVSRECKFSWVGHTVYPCPVCADTAVHDHDTVNGQMTVFASSSSGVVALRCMRSPGAVVYLENGTNRFEGDEDLPWGIVYSEPYMRPYTRLFSDSVHTVFVQGQLGVGKTKALNDFLASLDRAVSVLVVTYRIKLADKYHSELKHLGFNHYAQNRGRHERMIVCYDSIPRAQQGEAWDYVVLDECDSILLHALSSPFVKAKDNVHTAFLNIIKFARRVIAIDANFSRMCYDVLAMQRGHTGMLGVNNTWIRPTDRVLCEFQGSEEKFMQFIIDELRRDVHVVVASMTRGFTNKLYDHIAQLAPSKAVGVVNRDCVGGRARNHVGFNASKPDTWKGLDCLIYSPSISAGLSFEESWFDKLFIYAYISKDTPMHSELLQMMHRVRELRGDEVFLFIKRGGKSTIDDVEGPRSMREVVEFFAKGRQDDLLGIMGGLPMPANIVNDVMTGIDLETAYSLADVRTVWYAHVCHRRRVSLFNFKTELFMFLRRNGYKFEVLKFDSEIETAPPREIDTRATDAILDLEARFPGMPNLKVYENPLLLHNEKLLKLSEFLAHPEDYIKEVFERAADRHNGTKTIAVRDAIKDRALLRAWSLGCAYVVLGSVFEGLRDGGEFTYTGDSFRDLKTAVVEYETRNPRPSGNSKKLTRKKIEDKSQRGKFIAATRFLTAQLEELGFDISYLGHGRGAELTIGAKTQAAVVRRYLDDKPGFYDWVWAACKHEIAKENYQFMADFPNDASDREKAEWWVHGRVATHGVAKGATAIVDLEA